MEDEPFRRHNNLKNLDGDTLPGFTLEIVEAISHVSGFFFLFNSLS